MRFYRLYNPNILDFVEQVEEAITPVRNELMAREITEKAVHLLDNEHDTVPYIPGNYHQNLVNAAKIVWLQEQARHPSYSTFHDPVRFQLVIYSVNGLRMAQAHTSHRGKPYYNALEALENIEEHEETWTHDCFPNEETVKLVYDLTKTSNAMSKVYGTPEFYEKMIAVQPHRSERLLEYIKNQTNGCVLKKKPTLVKSMTNTGTTVDIMSVLRTVEETVDSIGESTVLSYGDEPKIMTVQDLMNPVNKTVWNVDNEKIEDIANMVISQLER